MSQPNDQKPYPIRADVGSWDWLNEAHSAYVDGKFDKALVAAVLFHAEAVDDLIKLLLEGAGAINVQPVGDEAKKG